MLHIDPNPFERQTDLLEQPQIREEVIIVFEASELLAKGKWSRALQKIDRYKSIVDAKNTKNETDEAMQMEVLLMRAFCFHQLGKLEQTQQILFSLLQMLDPVPDEEEDNDSKDSSQNMSINQLVVKHKSLAVRVHTLAASVVITSQKSSIDFKQIKHRLIQLMQPPQMRMFLPEVLGTLTGCKYFEPLIELTEIPGPLSAKLAKKHQLVADWKYIASLPEEAITFKQNAALLWQQLNCHNELIQCKKELKDIQNNNKSEYMLRLKRIKVFADGLLKLQQPIIPTNKQILLKWNIPLLIETIIPPPIDDKDSKSRSKSPMNESKMKRQNDKRMMLEDVIEKCSSFYQVYRHEIHSQTTNLLLNSNFMEEQIRKIRRTLAILVKLRSLRLRFSWKKIKITANPEKAVLNTNYLKNSHYS